MDPRIQLADSWRDAGRYWLGVQDDATLKARECFEHERRLRDEFRREVEARELQALADADLERRPRRMRVSAS